MPVISSVVHPYYTFSFQGTTPRDDWSGSSVSIFEIVSVKLWKSVYIHTYIQHTTHLVTSELTMKAIERVCHGSQQKANITTTVTNIFMTWKDYEQMWIVNSSDEERRESRCSRNAILLHSARRYHICKFISLSIYPIWLCCMRESGKKTLSPLFTDHKSKDDTARGRRR